MDSNGANQVNITNTPTIDEGYPSWSPDGTAIAFSRDGDIYKASPSGANPTRLTTSAITEFEPDWSPTSSQIVFRQGINGNDELWKMNANGTGQVEHHQQRQRGRGTARVVARRHQDRVHPRGVQGRRGLHDESGRHRGHPHHEQHRHGRQPGLAGDPVDSTTAASAPAASAPHGPGFIAHVPRLPGRERRRTLRLGWDSGTACSTGCFGGSEGKARTLDPTRYPLIDDLSRAVLFRRSSAPIKEGIGTVLGSHSAAATKPVTVKLDKRARRALRRRPPPKLTVSVVVRGANGGLLLKQRHGLRVQ